MLHKAPSPSADKWVFVCQGSGILWSRTPSVSGSGALWNGGEDGERVSQKPNITCVVKKKTANLVLEGDKKASVPGPLWQLVWL